MVSLALIDQFAVKTGGIFRFAHGNLPKLEARRRRKAVAKLYLVASNTGTEMCDAY